MTKNGQLDQKAQAKATQPSIKTGHALPPPTAGGPGAQHDTSTLHSTTAVPPACRLQPSRPQSASDPALPCPDHAAAATVGPGLAPPAPVVEAPGPGRRGRGHLRRRAARSRFAPRALQLRLHSIPRVQWPPRPRPRRTHPRPPRQREGRA
jgi:hypothetical protein